MKPNLTAEQCVRLKTKLGLDQTLGTECWFYVPGKGNDPTTDDPTTWDIVLVEDKLKAQTLARYPLAYVKYPSVEEMIELCQAKAQERWSGSTIGMRCFIDDDGTVTWPVGILNSKGKSIIGPVRETELIQSLYTLCEKLLVN